MPHKIPYSYILEPDAKYQAPMKDQHLSRGLSDLLEPVSKVVNTHLLVLAWGGDTWLTLSRRVPTLPVACTRCARLVTLQPNALHVTCDATCCFEAPTISIPFIFRKSWHMRIDVCSIMNELFLSNVILSILWHKEKGAKLTIYVLQGSRAFTKYCQTTYYRTGFYGDYSNTCKDRRSTDIIYMNFMPVQNKVKEKYLVKKYAFLKWLSICLN